jgi:hypothetical protein
MVLWLIYKAIKWTKGTDLTQYPQPNLIKMTEKTQARGYTRLDSILWLYYKRNHWIPQYFCPPVAQKLARGGTATSHGDFTEKANACPLGSPPFPPHRVLYNGSRYDSHVWRRRCTQMSFDIMTCVNVLAISHGWTCRVDAGCVSEHSERWPQHSTSTCWGASCIVIVHKAYRLGSLSYQFIFRHYSGLALWPKTTSCDHMSDASCFHTPCVWAWSWCLYTFIASRLGMRMDCGIYVDLWSKTFPSLKFWKFPYLVCLNQIRKLVYQFDRKAWSWWPFIHL